MGLTERLQKTGFSKATGSLSGRLLLLTSLFFLIGEATIFAPAIGRHYRGILNNHILSAELTVLPFTDANSKDLPLPFRQGLLDHADAVAVILKMSDQRIFYPIKPLPMRIDRTIDLSSDTIWDDMVNALDCLAHDGRRILHVLAPSRIKDAREISLILDEAPIRASLVGYAKGVVASGLFVLLFTASLMFFCLHFFLVSPMRRIIRSMTAFGENPEDASRILDASQAGGEIGQAERELAAMQRDLYGFLRQKERLAALGAAMARIQHDLRNILASAQLTSDRLAESDDPQVRRLTPALMASIDRAIGLATNTLKFGHADARPPERVFFPLAEVVDEAARSALFPAAKPCRLVNNVDRGIKVLADREQLFRVLLNLIHNAVQALTRISDRSGVITVSARGKNDNTEIDIADNGPGIDTSLQKKLFQPFALATTGGGYGLGLAIARELVRGHGGDLMLLTSSREGTVFRIVLPN